MIGPLKKIIAQLPEPPLFPLNLQAAARTSLQFSFDESNGGLL
jgi:hypothetical protein